MKQLGYKKQVCGITILCNVIPMGPDYTICICDDKNGHIGSTAMSVARPSLTGEGISATSSVLNRLGHKDEEIARHIAETVAMRQNCTVVCTCGIHIDHIRPEEIHEIVEACRELEERIMEDLE